MLERIYDKRVALSVLVLVGTVACAAPSRERIDREQDGGAASQEVEAPAEPQGPPAQEGGPPQGEIPRFFTPHVDVEPIAGYLFPAELSGGDATVETVATGVAVRGRMPLAYTRVVGAELGYDWREYVFRGTSTDLPGEEEPFDGLHTWTLVLTWLEVLGQSWEDDWQLYVRGSAQASAESGAKLYDGLSFGGLVVFGKQWTPTLRLGFGLAGFSQLEQNPVVFPAAQLVWNMAESWTMSVVGPELVITKQFDERRDLAFVGEYDYRFYRLKDSGATMGGTFGDQRFPLALRYTHALGEHSRIRLWGGVDLFRRLEFDLDEDVKLDRADVSPYPFLGLSFLLAF